MLIFLGFLAGLEQCSPCYRGYDDDDDMRKIDHDLEDEYKKTLY